MLKNLKLDIRTVSKPQALFVLFVVIITLNVLYIQNDSFLFFSKLRIALILLAAFGFSILLKSSVRNWMINRDLFRFLSLFLFVLLYGETLSSFYGGYKYFQENYKLNVYLISSALLAVSLHLFLRDELAGKESKNSDWYLSIYFIFIVVFLIATGAVSFEPTPVFNYEVLGQEGPRRYSQSVTAFFAVGFLLMLLNSYKGSLISRIVFLALASIFFGFALFCGARGEFFIALLVAALIILQRPRYLQWGACVAVLIAGIVFLATTDVWRDIVVIDRTLHLFRSGTFGGRDELLAEVFYLFVNKPVCLLTGCGFNYFQYYYNYEFGSYPHNALVEFLVTYGLIIGMPVVYFVFNGIIWLFTRTDDQGFGAYFCLFLFLVSLKGGSLVGITSLPIMLVFAYLGVKATSIGRGGTHK